MEKQKFTFTETQNKSVFVKPTIFILTFENDSIIRTSGEPTCDVTKSDLAFGFDPNETI